MRFFDLISTALCSLRQNRLTSALMTASVAIGTAATLFVASAGGSAKTAVAAQLDRLGVSGGIIYPTRTAVSAGINLTAEDAASVMAHVSGVGAVAPLTVSYGSYQMKNWQGSAILYGTDSATLRIWEPKLLYGRFLSENDCENARNCVVIDSSFGEKLYHRKNIVGKTLKLSVGGSYTDFEIIGVIEPQGETLNLVTGGNLPPFVYLPYTAAQALDQSLEIGQLLIEHPASANQVTAYLSRLHRRENSFASENISGLRQKLNDAAAISARSITAVAAVSVAVAGLGLMTAMLSGAAERRREIGIWMSVGADRKTIAAEFVAESMLISLIGGGIGVLCVEYGFLAIERLTGYGMELTLGTVMMTLVAVTVCGMLFSVLPAMRAASMDPVEALREGS